MEAKHVLANLAIILLFVSATALSRNEQALDNSFSAIEDDDTETDVCVYTLYIRTSKIILGGTDSIISINLYDETGSGISINDLETWGGVMEEGHNYYERGNLDIFTGRGPCLRRPVCKMKLESDGSNFSHSWFCNYVEVTVTGPHIPCNQQLFTVDEWLSRDRGPKELFAIRDNCSNDTSTRLTAGHGHPTKFAPRQILLPAFA